MIARTNREVILLSNRIGSPLKDMVEVADRVWRLGTKQTNWYVVVDGNAVTVVDTGFPGHVRQLEPGLERIGRKLSDIAAVVITHAHVDHTGFAEHLRTTQSIPVYVNADDTHHGKARLFPPLTQYRRPGSWPLLADGLRNAMLFTPAIRETTNVVDGQVLPIPGELQFLHLPGHTPGNGVFESAPRSCVFTGDALVTLDPYTQRKGPRLVFKEVNGDAAEARSSLAKLTDRSIDTVLPGHGEPWREGLAAAAQAAMKAGG